MTTTAHDGDIGTVIRFTVTDEAGEALDISGVSTKQIKIKQLDGETKTRAASFETDGTDGVLTYTTAAGDLADATGKAGWYAQAYLAGLDGWSGHSAVAEFTVAAVL